MTAFPLGMSIRLKYRKPLLGEELAAEVDHISPEVYPESVK